MMRKREERKKREREKSEGTEREREREKLYYCELTWTGVLFTFGGLSLTPWTTMNYLRLLLTGVHLLSKRATVNEMKRKE